MTGYLRGGKTKHQSFQGTPGDELNHTGQC